MQKAVFLAFTLILGWICSSQALVLPEPLYPTQENFDLTRFLGTWHDVAVAKTCRHDCPTKDSAIGKLVLQKGSAEDKLQMTRTVLKNGTCKHKSGEYHLTPTPGRFRYAMLFSVAPMTVTSICVTLLTFAAEWDAQVDAYVVHTNYEEYALMIMMKERSQGQNCTTVKLYSEWTLIKQHRFAGLCPQPGCCNLPAGRTMEVRDTVLDDFQTLVGEQGMSDDNVVIKLNKGDCVPGEQVEEPIVVEKVKRDVESIKPLEEMEFEGSADDTLMFNGSEACSLGVEAGPCFGIHHRYFYNSSAMSCQMFHYGGCLGNKNNFKSERECLQRCRTEAVCRLPLTAVTCSGEPLNWSFDSILGECVPYKAGFCQTNGNKFYSKAECDEYCGVKNAKLLED